MAIYLTSPQRQQGRCASPLLALRACVEHSTRQSDSQNLRRAVDAQRFLAADAAAHHHRGVIFHKHALIEAAAVKARDKNRTNDGQADLAAVGVAAEEQGDAVVRSPDEVVRRVAEAESETVARG